MGSDMNIGFVGVGRMGANMARRLADCGFHVTAVCDVNRAAATKLAGELGCAACQDLSEVTAQSDVIITVVSDDAAMRQIFAKSGDSLLVNSNGKLFINCATITPQVHLEVEELAGKMGAHSLEACMASSITQARDGSLYLMCGGKEEAFRAAQPILEKLGKTVRYVGKAGEAAKVKALVNMVMNINTAGLAEGLGLGETPGSISRCCVRFSAPTRVCCKPTANMQNREHSCFSRPPAAKDSGIAPIWHANWGWISSPAPPSNANAMRKGWANSTSGILWLTFKNRHQHDSDHVEVVGSSPRSMLD